MGYVAGADTLTVVEPAADLAHRSGGWQSLWAIEEQISAMGLRRQISFRPAPTEPSRESARITSSVKRLVRPPERPAHADQSFRAGASARQ